MPTVKRYWLESLEEVSEEAYVQAERNAGFRRHDDGKGPATAGFTRIKGNHKVSGRITIEEVPEKK